MAKKEEKGKPKQVLERTYSVPLRKEFSKVPKYKRAKKAMTAVRQFLERHMKGSPVKLGKQLNQKVWERGIKNPPHHIKVTAIKYDDSSVKAELIGFPVEEAPKKKKEKKAGEPKGKKDSIQPGKQKTGKQAEEQKEKPEKTISEKNK